ncbi:MAG TPA: ATP-binding protein, partial [Dissulfurispiraceae bacterium]|nr:ATP-binding protein [Dissulfurispiraceae bacterium]
AGLLVGIAALSFILFYRFHIWSKPALYIFATAGIFVLTYTFRFDDAIERLDKAYENILPHLRWKGPAAGKTVLHGISGIFTPNGIQSKMAVLTEVTSHLIFEKELADRALLSNVQGVALFGPDGKNIILNEHARMFCEANSVPAGTAERFARGIAPYSMEEGDISKALSSAREGAADMSFILSLPLPAKKFYKVDASPLQAGNDRYLLVVLSDITKLKELEILKGQMISVVSHELRTPMTSVQGFSELLILGLEGKMKDYAVIIHEEAKRLTKFINAFLDITRMEDGKLPINRVPVAVPDLVREAATSVSPLARQRGVPVTVDCPEKTNTIMIDRDLTKQCVINLAENALKYSRPGKDVIIRVRDEDKSLRIDVIDHGCGISQEDIGRVFEKFYRVRNEGTENVKGFGLGLIFVKDAVEAQGGRVTVESVYGEGSTFSIIFPVGN